MVHEEQKYTQCTLKKDITTQVSWIPQEFAKKGKILELKEGQNWQNGWEVISIGTTVTAKFLLETLHLGYKRTRKASDI